MFIYFCRAFIERNLPPPVFLLLPKQTVQRGVTPSGRRQQPLLLRVPEALVPQTPPWGLPAQASAENNQVPATAQGTPKNIDRCIWNAVVSYVEFATLIFNLFR